MELVKKYFPVAIAAILGGVIVVVGVLVSAGADGLARPRVSDPR